MYTKPTYQDKKMRTIQQLSLAIFAFFVVSFIGTEVYPYIHGPEVNLLTLPDGATLTEPLIRISGKALHTKDLFVNGSPLATAPDGTFDEKLLLNPGYNIITVQARDRFGTLETTNYRLMLHESNQKALTVNVLSPTNN